MLVDSSDPITCKVSNCTTVQLFLLVTCILFQTHCFNSTAPQSLVQPNHLSLSAGHRNVIHCFGAVKIEALNDNGNIHKFEGKSNVDWLVSIQITFHEMH